MMTPKECADAWKVVCEQYDATIPGNKPSTTMSKIIDALGREKTKEVFATVAAIKDQDGRISRYNRQYLKSIEINPESTVWSHENPMSYAELDYIHTAHIDNLISELQK